MAGPLDELVAAGVGAWSSVAQAWIKAVNDIVVAWLDLADVESGRRSFNKEPVVVPAQQAPTDLHPGPFSNWDRDHIPPEALAVVPAGVKAGEATEVLLVVQPPEGACSGTYTGSLCDPNGACLLDEIGVYVVGDTPPLRR
jgi:hypothetical protein